MLPAFIDQSKIPHKPGVYVYKNNKGEVLYVGKAIDLYHRVSSYFHSSRLDLKTRNLVERIKEVETVIVESEIEALILEANLIKKYLPLFNIKLIDDKDYLYIAVTKDNFPKIITARKKDLGLVRKYWGPFPSGKTVRETLKSLRRIFPWCANITSPQGRQKKRPCFYYHIGLCPGVCAGVISQKDFNKIISNFSKFMDGKKEQLLAQLSEEMTEAAHRQQFEEAAKVKKIIAGINYLTQSNRTKLYLENPNFLEEETKLALEELKEDLGLVKLPERIEGYDISNISGKEATGSMVVLTSGEVDKSQYRKFKIRISGRPNDVGMMCEMVRRRFTHKDWAMPDLILVDGGKPQVNGTKLEIRNLKLEIPLFGLAKKREWLYSPEGKELKLPKKSLALKLLQKLRDEAHRFALSYHRKLRGNILFK
ncbi:excinuclease ABC subunit UvrC [Candidatus Daviesbacteria bacterium]|nr:excinuclease ABC subunit UvrC [Candidatus Daviesbacteria bacterium]